MSRTQMRNVSTTYQEKYQTADGNVTVTNFKPRVWQVHPRGHAPFMVGSKQEAFKQAIGIATRHWGLPKSEAFPARKTVTRAHATKKSPAQLQREIDEALAPHKGRWDDSSGAWQTGYDFAKEAGLHETRAEQREILKRVSEGARSAYDRGFVAAYQDMLGVPRSPATNKSTHATKKRSGSRSSHATKSDSPRILKISRGKTFAGQRSITAEVQYPGEKPSRVEFVGPSIGGPGPVVMISRPAGHQTFVTDPSRFGNFGPDWVRRFFETA